MGEGRAAMARPCQFLVLTSALDHEALTAYETGPLPCRKDSKPPS